MTRLESAAVCLCALMLSLNAYAWTWTPRADPGAGASGFGRGLHGAGVLGNEIYVAGGGFLGNLAWGSEQTVQAYDPVADTWSNVPPMSKRRTAPASTVATFGGQPRLYVIGGMDLTDFPLAHFNHGDIEEYDPVANSWRLVATCQSGSDCLPVPDRTWGACAVTVDNRVFVMGGVNNNLSGLTDRLASYDPDTDSFQKLAAMPVRASDGTCVAVGRKIYWFGGYDEFGGWGSAPSPQTHVYDVDTGLWSTASSSAPTPRADAAAIAIGNTVYVVGGWDGSGTYSGLFNTVDAYDVATDTWTGNLSDPLGCVEDSPGEGIRGRSGLTLHVANDGTADRLYAVGGTIGISLPTRCNESSPLQADLDPPLFGGLTAAFELTDCPDPAAPTVRLEWSAASDASPPVTYDVYRGSTPFFAPDASSRVAASLSGTFHEDVLDAGACGSTLFYLVRAQDSASPPNAEANEVRLPVDVLCPSPPVPSPIGNRLFLSKDGAQNPVLDWSGYSATPGVTHYHVYRSTLRHALGAVLYEPATKVQTDSFAFGPIYFYDVRSATGCGDAESVD